MKLFEIAGGPLGATAQLPPDVAAAFEQLGDLQRGEPEVLMVRAQHVFMGGPLNVCIEHVGDLTNRMTRQGGLMDWGLNESAVKIERCYRLLAKPYGFDREFEENIRSNLAYKQEENPQLSEASYRRAIDTSLRRYAEAHQKLPVYNYAQWAAREAAVCLGMKAFTAATQHLSNLMSLCRDFEKWKQKALEYRKDEKGQLLQYPYPRQYLKINGWTPPQV